IGWLAMSATGVQDIYIDYDDISSVYIATRTVVAELRVHTLFQIVGFHHADTCAAIFSSHDGGVIAGRKGAHDRRFQVISGWYARGLNCRGVIRPIVIAINERASAIVQLQDWIRQEPAKTQVS